VFFFHFFFFFKYSNVFKQGPTHIAVYKKKINYFKHFFNTIFLYLKSKQLSALHKSRFKSMQLTSKVLPYLGALTAGATQLVSPFFYFFWSNSFRIRCLFSQHIFFFPPYGKRLTATRRKPKRNLFLDKLLRFF
jgi:hypothetical protein